MSVYQHAPSQAIQCILMRGDLRCKLCHNSLWPTISLVSSLSSSTCISDCQVCCFCTYHALTVLLCHVKAELVARSYQSNVGKNVVYDSVQEFWWGSNGQPFYSFDQIVLDIAAQLLKGGQLCISCHVSPVVCRTVQVVVSCYKINHNMFVSHTLIHLRDKLHD